MAGSRGLNKTYGLLLFYLALLIFICCPCFLSANSFLISFLLLEHPFPQKRRFPSSSAKKKEKEKSPGKLEVLYHSLL